MRLSWRVFFLTIIIDHAGEYGVNILGEGGTWSNVRPTHLRYTIMLNICMLCFVMDRKNPQVCCSKAVVDMLDRQPYCAS